MPDGGTVLEFECQSKTQRHPVVIDADFESVLVKKQDSRGTIIIINNTSTIR